jgi:hypothetical protein
VTENNGWKAPAAIIGIASVVVAALAIVVPLAANSDDTERSSQLPTSAQAAPGPLPATDSPIADPSSVVVPDDPIADSPRSSPNALSTNDVTALRSVTVSELCNTRKAESYLCSGSHGDGTIQVGGQIFSHEAESNDGPLSQSPNWYTILGYRQGGCEAVSLRFAVDDSSRSTHVNLRIVQEGEIPIEVTSQKGEIGRLETRLNGGKFDIQGNSTSGSSVKVVGTIECRI